MFFEHLKANLIIIIFFGLILALGYWAIISIQVDPSEFESQAVDVRPIIENEPTGFTQTPSSDNSSSPVTQSPVTPTATTTTTGSGQNSELVSALEKLITDNVLMKAGSRGTRVGTVQEFLNIYNGTDSKVDNDFGQTTENQIKVFQRAEGLTADGQTGPNTYRKMIEWLNKQ
jgi:peptidoglycan hydrolase-like protein with peptidoglycan-binding domain